MNDNTPNKSIEKLYTEISSIITEARNKVYKSANSEMVNAYWKIGKRIVEEDQNGENRAEYGIAIVKELSKRLTKVFGKSFGERNLRHIRQFYIAFENWNALRSELSWTHYRLLLKVSDAKARAFYVEETILCNWSARTLDKQIGNLYYQRMIMSKDKVEVKNESHQFYFPTLLLDYSCMN
ncbi:DUF1016 N-terminal domain-containing protein [Brumimicrobium oceani]|nr:DUF1016 N-terminal domain-containing protein [Brumimicrobium oceani]